MPHIRRLHVALGSRTPLDSSLASLRVREVSLLDFHGLHDFLGHGCYRRLRV